MFRLISALSAVMMLALVVRAETRSDTVVVDHAAYKLPATTVSASPRDGKANQIVVYTASWCSPCQRLKPVLMSLKKEGYKVVYRDVDRDSDKLSYPYDVVPTIYFVRNDVVIKKETGYRTKEQIKKNLILEVGSEPLEPAIGWH